MNPKAWGRGGGGWKFVANFSRGRGYFGGGRQQCRGHSCREDSWSLRCLLVALGSHSAAGAAYTFVKPPGVWGNHGVPARGELTPGMQRCPVSDLGSG